MGALNSCKRLIEADRFTLFMTGRDEDGSDFLWSKLAVMGTDHKENSRKIRVAFGVGIAGFVAVSQQSENIKNAYSDPRFNRAVDKATGYRTRNILCARLVQRNGTLIGVAQF